jgi:hypothetical protein
MQLTAVSEKDNNIKMGLRVVTRFMRIHFVIVRPCVVLPVSKY